MSARPLALLLAAPAAALVLLAGCGEEGGDGAATDPTSGSTSPTSPASTGTETGSETSTGAASGLPSCTEVWVPGTVLPRTYRGCSDGAADVPPEVLRCSNGQKIVTFDPYWAVPGAEVQETSGLDDDPAFATVRSQCQA